MDGPERDKDQNEAEKDRLPDKVADTLEDPLRAADLLLFTRVEIQNGLDILAGLVAFGFEWRALAIRWRPRRNSSFGFHQGMLLDPACPDPLEKWMAGTKEERRIVGVEDGPSGGTRFELVYLKAKGVDVR